MDTFKITRRIDELGRIVIPKEIRNNMQIREGELLEISVQNKTMIINKYYKMDTIKDISKKVCDIISSVKDISILVTDRDKIITTSDNVSMLNGKEINNELKNLIDNRESYISNNKDNFYDLNKYVIALPIINESDCSGLVIVLNDRIEESLNYAKIAKKLIENSLN